MEKWNKLFIEDLVLKYPLITWGSKINHIICETYDFGQQLMMNGKKEKCFKIGQKCNAYAGSYFCLKFLKISLCIIFTYLKRATKKYMDLKFPRSAFNLLSIHSIKKIMEDQVKAFSV